jgi:hypothetical protein
VDESPTSPPAGEPAFVSENRERAHAASSGSTVATGIAPVPPVHAPEARPVAAVRAALDATPESVGASASMPAEETPEETPMTTPDTPRAASPRAGQDAPVSPGDPWLTRLAERWRETRATDGAPMRLTGERLVVEYPRGLEALGERAARVLEALTRAGSVEPDPAAPLRSVRTVDGARVVLLTAEATRLVCRLADAAGATPTRPETEHAPDPQSARNPPDTRADPEASVPRSKPSRTRPNRPAPLTAAERAALGEAFVAAARAAATASAPGVELAEGWLWVSPTALATLVPQGRALSPYRLTRTLAEHPECRVGADGRVGVRVG